jgi:hypothetical protein
MPGVKNDRAEILERVAKALRDGKDGENLVTTSMVRNAAKANWLLEELGWRLFPEGSKDWDGLTGLFVEIYASNSKLHDVSSLQDWNRAAEKVFPELF